MKQGRSLNDLAAEISRQMETKKDYIAPSGKLEMVSPADGFASALPEGHKVGLNVPVNGHREIHGVNPIAHSQVGTKLGIPAAYYSRMLEEQPALLARNVNTWLQAQPEQKHMVRTIDGNVRALLSDKYKRIDNYDVMQVALPEILGVPKVAIASAELTESRLYLKVVTDSVEGEITKGDPVRGGFVISNSEVGQGLVSVSPFIERLVCTNGMIATEYAQKRRHVGRRVEEEDFSIYSDSTLELDMQAFFGKVRDSIRATLQQQQFDLLLNKFREARKIEFGEKLAEAVTELAQKRFNLTDVETKGTLHNLLSGGSLNLWGLANAVTRLAQDSESYDRATELEAIGYKVINIDPKDVRRLEAA